MDRDDIIQRNNHRTEEILQDYYLELFRRMPIATVLLDDGEYVIEANANFLALFGYTQEEVAGRHINALVANDSIMEEAEAFTRYTLSGGMVNRETVRYGKDGSPIEVQILSYPVRARDKTVAVYAMYLDIRERKVYENRMNIFAKILENSTEAIAIIEANGTIQWVNDAFRNLIGHLEDQWNEGLSNLGILTPLICEEMLNTLDNGHPWRGEVTVYSLNGEDFPAWVNAFPLNSAEPDGEDYVLLISDISEMKRKDEKLDFLSRKDQLTGLSNRNHFMETLRNAVFNAEDDVQMAILFMDLDDFKLVNENISHAAGDEILKYFSALLKSCLRDTDVVCRYGGDEFILLVKGKNAKSVANRVVERVLTRLQQPIFVNEVEIHIGASIGIAFFPQDGIDAGSLIRHSEIAMYNAKRERKSSVQVYDASQKASLRDIYLLKNALRNVLRDRELHVVYQPIIDGRTEAVTAVEALARWTSGKLGPIPPNRFIPLAEDTDMIGEIGDWILTEVVRQAMEWQQKGIAVAIAVNLSVRQLEDPGFADRLLEIVTDAGLKPSLLELEVTESIQMQKTGPCPENLHQLKNAGFKFSMDDFGTGYSSLAQLSQLPLTSLKIDRSFTEDTEKNGVLISTIIGLAQNLGLSVVAEGVETQQQKAFLKNLSCDYYQGYHFSAPLSAEEFEKYYHTRRDQGGTP